MAKNKDNPNYEAQSRIGRNNKNRGRAFERKCADKLGWTRVPYSGGSGEWGKGDVVDGFHSGKGIWVAECKTQDGTISGNLSIKDKWLKQMQKEADETTRIPVLLLRLNGDTRSYVLLPEASFDYLWEQTQRKSARLNADGYAERLMIDEVVDTHTRGKGLGFVIEKSVLRRATSNHIAEKIWVTHPENLPSAYYLLDFDDFAEIVRDLSIMAFE